MNFLSELLIAIGPSLVTGFIAYFISRYKSKEEIRMLQLSKDKDFERIQQENKDKYEEFKRQREHDLRLLREERKNDLEFYKQQLDAELKQNEDIHINNLTSRIFNDLFDNAYEDVSK